MAEMASSIVEGKARVSVLNTVSRSVAVIASSVVEEKASIPLVNTVSRSVAVMAFESR